MKIYVSTWDKYLVALKPFSYLLNKFWFEIPEVIVLNRGTEKPDFELPSNFDFINLGENRGPNYWTTDLGRFFESINDEHFIFAQEDFFLLEPVNERVYKVLESFKHNPDVGRINLTNDMEYRWLEWRHRYHECGYTEEVAIIKSTPNAEYRVSCQMSIWSRKYMSYALTPGLNPSQFETQLKVKNDGWEIIASKKPHAVTHATGIRKGNLNNLMFNCTMEYDPHELDLETLIYMKESNII